MVLHQVHTTAKQLFQKLGGQYIVIKNRRHGYKQVNITPFLMLITGNRAKQAHRTYSKLLLKFDRMTSYEIDIFL